MRLVVPHTITSFGNSCFQGCKNSRIEFLRTSTFTINTWGLAERGGSTLIFHSPVAPTTPTSPRNSPNLKVYAPADANQTGYHTLLDKISTNGTSYTISFTL